ncbi:MAG: hypothetical protein ABSG01_15420 [Anaerolineales bacterium]|jgi:hypothetical protein
MEKRYKALRFIGSVYKVIGIIIGVLTVIGALGFCVISAFGGTALSSLSRSYGSSGAGGLFSGLLGGILVGGMILLYGGITAITTYALGEGVYLFIGLEENTRATAELLQKQGVK